METQVTPYTLPLAVSLLLTVGLGWYGLRTWRRDGERIALAFAALMGTFVLWEIAGLVTLTAVDRGPKLVAIYAANLVTPAVTLSWLWFALCYADRDGWFTRRRLALLSVEPAVVWLATVTNAWHGLMWSSTTVTATTPRYLARDPAILWNAHALYSYAIVLVGSYLILHTVYDAQQTYRLQGAVVLLGALVPLVGNAATFLGIGPEHVNLTPALGAVSGLCFGIGVFRYRVLDLVPVARDTVVDRMAEGYVVLDGRDRIVDLNPAACRMGSVAEDAAVGQPFDEVFPDAAGLLARRDGGPRAADGDGPREPDLLFETGDERRFVEASVSPLGDPGSGSGRVVVFRDVSDRREVELRYQRLIENASDLVTVLDADGTITYESPSVERVLGHDPDDLVGEQVFEFVHPDDRERAIAEFSRAVSESGSQFRLEYRFRHADGTWRTVESLGKNLLDDPVVEGMVVNSRDVTDRREQERRLEETNERLERFASVVSHDLRNPLTVAAGNLDLARAGDEAAFDEVAAAHDRMERIIENVLALARDGEAVEAPEPVALSAVTSAAWGAVATDEAELSVEGEATILADADRLQRALENCFRNSIEHAPEENDPSTLTITVGVEEGTLYVADDGVGVSDDALDALFDEGYTTADEGTGLGLSIVRTIATAHGWTVSANHAESGGVRISFDGVGTA